MDKKRNNLNGMLLELQNIEFGYTKKKIISDLSMKINKGDLIGIIGESGCGKTTLLRLICLLEKPQKGKIFFNNEEIELSNKNAVNTYKSKIGFIFQELNLWPHLSVLENITLPLTVVKKYEKKYAKELALSILKRVELQDYKDIFPNQLSLGQKQRCAIARTLCYGPEIILCDEITSSLDVDLKEIVMQLMVETMIEKEISGLFISHDVSIIEKYCKTIYRMKNGKMYKNTTM